LDSVLDAGYFALGCCWLCCFGLLPPRPRTQAQAVGAETIAPILFALVLLREPEERVLSEERKRVVD